MLAVPLQTAMLVQHQLKKTEQQQWYTAVRTLLEERDAQAREAVAGFERSKKQLASLLAGLREYEREQPISVGKVGGCSSTWCFYLVL